MTHRSLFVIALLILACLVGCTPAATPAPEATDAPLATRANPTLIPVVAASAAPAITATAPPVVYECSAIRMTELGAYAMLKDPADVAVLGSRVYIAEGGGLHVIDASNSASPTEAGYLAAQSGYDRIIIGETDAILATDGSVELIDLSSPDVPVRSAALPIVGNGPIEIAREGGFALVRDALGVVHILEVTADRGLREISAYDPPGGIWGGEVFGNEMFAKLDRARAMGLPTMALGDGYLYVADLDGGLRVVGLSQAGTPNEVGVRMEDLNPSNVARFGHSLITFSEAEGEAAWSWRLSQFDLSSHPELADPAVLGTLELAGGTDIASICSYLSDFLSLSKIGEVDQAAANDFGLGDVAGALTGVANQGDTLYLLDPDRGLLILEVEPLR